MKHIFVINPKAGKRDISPTIKAYLEEKNFEADTYITKGVNDAKVFVEDYIKKNPKEKLRFYVCGGDGTLNEVLNGLIGNNNVSFACYPSGSGNDFIKNFGAKEAFLDLDNLIDGVERKVDIFKVNDRYTINICNLGFDAVVADNMVRFKKKKGVSGKMAYSLAVIYSLLHSIKNHAKISVDGKVIADNSFLLCTIANGMVYGGGYYCAPNAIVDDGLLDITVVRPLSRIKFMSILGIYKKGKHLEHPRIKKLLTYVRGKKVEVASSKPLIYCMDGEIEYSNKIEIEVIPLAVNFVLPRTNT